ncbi:MAG TPA: sugar phosphate isomerase/epimerase, partial [bacterium]|nr:sugar phosphate isomerase/epimerase [bacterium]
MKIGICNEVFQSWSIEKTIAFISKLGYDGLEIAPFTLADSVDEIPLSKREWIKQLSKENNIDIIGTHWLMVKPDGLSISSKDSDLRKKSSKYFEKLVKFTSDINGKI